jgi:hypothetical protein
MRGTDRKIAEAVGVEVADGERFAKVAAGLDKEGVDLDRASAPGTQLVRSSTKVGSARSER